MSDAPRPDWLTRADWRAGLVRSDAKKHDVVLFGPLVIAVTAIFTTAAIYTRNPFVLLPIVASIVVGTAALVRVLISGRRGMAEFRFQRLPFLIGSKVSGTVVIPFEVKPPIVHVQIACSQRMTETGRRGPGVVLPSQLTHADGKTCVPIEKRLPMIGFPTARGMFGSVTWTLIVMIDDPHYEVQFDIPVAPVDAEVFDTTAGTPAPAPPAPASPPCARHPGAPALH